MSDFKTLGAALVSRGYRIIPIERGQKGPKLKDWENLQSTMKDVLRWSSNGYAQGNIGVLTEETPAVDLDILDGEMAKGMEEWVLSTFGNAPVRIGRNPKRLLVFRATEPFRKQTSARFVSEDGNTHRVEILGIGQQFVSHGIHPDTKKPYYWTSFEELQDIDKDDLPELSLEDAQAVVQEFEKRAKARGWIKKGSAKGATQGADHDPLLDKRQPLLLSDEEIKDALALVGDNDDYDNWVKVGMALQHQFSGGEEGLALWIEWSSSAINFSEEGCVHRWNESFDSEPDRRPTTFASILKIAKENKQKAEEEAVDKLRLAITQAESEPELMRDIVTQIAKEEIPEYDQAILIDMIRKKLKKLSGSLVATKTIKNAINKAMMKEGVGKEELEIVLANHVLRHHYEDGSHIKRLGDIWWVYRNGVWRREDMGMVQQSILETLTRLKKEKNQDIQALQKEMKESRGDQLNVLVNTLFSLLSKMVAESSEDDPLNLKGFRSPRVINCLNGELWFNDDGSLEFEDHDADHKLTSQLGCDYDPDAECPTYEQSLRVVFQGCVDPENVIRHFCEVIGYIIQPTRDAAIWTMFKGPGENGKTFLLEIVSAMMGPRAVLPMSLAEMGRGRDPHFTDSLVGKLMLLDDDLETNTLLPDGWLKKLSEGKQISANPKNQKPFSFIARAIPFVLTNSWPTTVDMSIGLQRRIIAFETKHRLRDDEKDPQHKKDILDHELPGVLNLFAKGFQRFLERGSKFDIPDECVEAKNRLMQNANPIVRFHATMLIKDEESRIKINELYDRYIDWIRHWEYSGQPMGRNKFYNAVESLGLERVNHGGVLKYRGFRLLEMPNAAEAFEDDEEPDF